jgi:hypothetical protein
MKLDREPANQRHQTLKAAHDVRSTYSGHRKAWRAAALGGEADGVCTLARTLRSALFAVGERRALAPRAPCALGSAA